MSTAVLLIAHGSRQDEANEELEYWVRELKKTGPYSIVVASFLELVEPDIDAGAALCVEQGAERVLMVPYLLSPGVHLHRDLTAARARLCVRFPQVEFVPAQAMGRHPAIGKILLDRAREAGGWGLRVES